MEGEMGQNRMISYINNIIACTFSDNEYTRWYAKRNAIIQILVATVAFILLMRVFPAGLVQNHTLSKQKAFDAPEKAGSAGDAFTASDKKLQTVYFEKEHLYQITLYMQCSVSETSGDSEGVLFRLYDDTFSCIYEEDIDNRKIEKKGFLTATPDLDVEKGRAYYYEILVGEESTAVYTLPTADRTALAQTENSTLFIDGIINDEVCLVADFDYSSPLTVAGIIGYDICIIAAALVIYLLILMAVRVYEERFLQDSEQIGKYARCALAAISILASVVLLVCAVVQNCFGGELWDRLFFAVGIVVGQAWLIGFLWRMTRVIRTKTHSKMSAASMIGLTWRNYIQTVSFGLLFYALCQYANADRLFYQYKNTRWMLIFLAIALLMNYNERQFVNKISIIWLVLGFVGSLWYCKTAGTDEEKQTLARLTCGVVVSWGLLVWNILLNLLRTKAAWLPGIGDRLSRQFKKNKQQVLFIALWVVYSLLMYANRYEKVWVFTATLPFLTFLFAPNTLAAKCRFLKNFGNGVLLSFALVTVFCLAHRPHHYWMLYRYGGIFHTVACTGMYLTVVFGVALAKLCGKSKNRKNMFLFCYPEYFVTACTTGFILLTMSRTAFLTVAVMVFMIMVLTTAAYHKGAKRIVSELGILAAVCLLSFPMVYTAVRMVPAVVNDPVRYDIEFQDRYFMIYEGDPIDSDKYMTVRRFFATLFGRFQTSSEESEEADAGRTGEFEWQEAGELAYIGDGLAGLDTRYFSMGNEDGNNSDEEEEDDISNGRFKIYRDYIEEIGIQGHPHMGPLDRKGNEYAHAHNSYLQVAYNFGLIAGLVFLVLCALTLWRSVQFFMEYGSKYSIVLVPFAMIVAFGFISLTEWAYHPCIPAGFSFILMQMVLMRDSTPVENKRRPQRRTGHRK